ncbi:bifunctional DNA primase/polymerase [Streptomyces sp. TS71-3]|uniref:bifunctional DNA primase/polymerase n=1 Tax=Streptomyces sp. TS71-3 TaxID=2733862 RepID=UPI001BB2F8AC|nr:bifunctional DNA primase/polymerase [Streptomyces sp. TS71-3]
MQRYENEVLLDAAVRYAEERHWEVFPGAWLEVAAGEQKCSCRVPACAMPGAHALGADWRTVATESATAVRRMWEEHPTAAVLLPTGQAFDVLDVPESAGFLALARMERMQVPVGPVTQVPTGRMQFFVLAGGAAKVPGLLRKLGWSPSGLDLAALGEGDYVVAPPTRIGGRGVVQWARRPTTANRWLPDVAELVAAVAYACGREAAV